MGRQPKKIIKSFESPYKGKISQEVELFTWEKLDYVEQIKTKFNIS
jgi:S-adenosylmethionine synthetase